MFQLLRASVAFVSLWRLCAATSGGEASSNCGNFTLSGGQIFTPGLAILDAPQPCTPEGGDFLQVPLDISGNGQLPFPASKNDNQTTAIHNITIFLFSYDTQRNFTISNGTGTTPPLAPVLDQEPSSTVKHVNWAWPDCLVGNGQPNSTDSVRGEYNISIHQNFRMNGTDYYTVFDLPINVTNEISQTIGMSAAGNKPAPGPLQNGARVNCSLLENPMMDDQTVKGSTKTPSTQPYLGGPVSISGVASSSSNGASGEIGNDAAGQRSAGTGPLMAIAVAVAVLGFVGI